MTANDTSGSILDEPEKHWGVWLQSNVLTLIAGVLAVVVIGYLGYWVSTNGYEVSGAIFVIASITLGCHIAEWARVLFLKRRRLM